MGLPILKAKILAHASITIGLLKELDLVMEKKN